MGVYVCDICVLYKRYIRGGMQAYHILILTLLIDDLYYRVYSYKTERQRDREGV